MNRAELEAAIGAQEALRGQIADDIVDTTVAALRSQLAALDQPQQRRGLATVLFADVSGFTAMSELLDPEDLSSRMNAVWDRLDGAITRHGGHIDKHIGDAVMALWGTDATSESDAEQAVRAGLAMQEAMADFRAETGHELRVRVGINTGGVLLGAVGSTEEFTAMGDAVNLASRLEGLAPVDGVLISHDTYRHVKGVFSVEERPPVDVRGKRRPVRSYLVHAEQPRAFRLGSWGVEGVETQMIGRNDELAALRAGLIEVVEAGAARSFLVSGEAGIGKSRLLYEFEDWLRLQRSDVRLFKGRADEQHASHRHFILRDMLLSRFEIPTDAPADEAHRALRSGVAELAPSLSPRTVDLLAALAGIVSETTGELQVESSAAANELMHRALVEFLTDVSSTMPVVILLEDVHWADPATLDAIDAVAECVDTPIFTLQLTRPSLFEARPSHHEGPTVHIHLEPLDPAATEGLVREVLQNVSELPQAVVEQLGSAAAGNPFFVEEMVKVLVDDAAIEIDGDEWTLDASQVAAGRRPSTINGLLQARIDRLAADERAVLEQASVIGATFWDTALHHSALDEAHAVSACLAGLEEKELVFKEPTSVFADTNQYRFKHALLHDAVYDRILKPERVRGHRAVAGWYVGRSDPTALSATIARHFEAAGDTADAARWHASAGRHAAQALALDDAVAHLTLAVESEELDNDVRWQALKDLGLVLTMVGRHEDGLATADLMVSLAEEMADPDRHVDALVERSFALSRLGHLSACLEVCEEAARLATTDPKRAEVLCEQGWIYERLGRIPEAIEAGRSALALVDDAFDWRTVFTIRSQLGVAFLRANDLDAAEHQLRTVESMTQEADDEYREAAAVINLGVLSSIRGDRAGAIERYERALDITRRIGDVDQEALSHNNIGRERLHLAEDQLALVELHKAADLFSAAGAGEHTPETFALLALAQLATGDPGAAVQSAQRSLELSERSGAPEQLSEAWIALGAAARASGGAPNAHTVEPSRCFARGVQLVEDDNQTALEQYLALVAGVLERAGDNDGAADVLRLVGDGRSSL